MPPQTAMLIRPAVKMFHRSLYTRYNEPDTHKSMTLYIIALGGLHLFYVKREGTLSRVG